MEFLILDIEGHSITYPLRLTETFSSKVSATSSNLLGFTYGGNTATGLTPGSSGNNSNASTTTGSLPIGGLPPPGSPG